mgnify:FL=1
MTKLNLIIGLVLSVLRKQLLRFEEDARYFYRFMVFAVLSLGVYSVAMLFKTLPVNAVDILLANVFTLPGTILTAYVVTIGLFGLYLGVLAKNVAKTL